MLPTLGKRTMTGRPDWTLGGLGKTPNEADWEAC